MKTFAALGFAVVTLTFVAATPSSAVAAPPAFIAHDHDVHVDYSTRGWKSRHLHDHHDAHDLANFLRSIGARVRIEHGHGFYDVVYSCSPRMKWFHEDRDAHRFARDLRRYGFTARVHH
jgi:hypothetical protein